MNAGRGHIEVIQGQGVVASYGPGHNHGTLTKWLVSIVEALNLEA